MKPETTKTFLRGAFAALAIASACGAGAATARAAGSKKDIDDAVLAKKKMEIHAGSRIIIIGDTLDESTSTESLRARVQNLEWAVKYLYYRLGYWNEDKPKSLCTIETESEDYTAVHESESKARMNVIEECKAKESFKKNCSPSKVKCQKDAS